ncbi:MAG: thiamine phosphate synthase [Erythrobacter sp.]|nr:thiamine phosphate synthase [Erythrobacter sp.]
MSDPQAQLYLISPLEVGGSFPDRLERALAADAEEGVQKGGALVTAFQFRVKGVDQHEAARLADPLQAICTAHDVAFIVNDSVSLAKRLDADGVHLGQNDGDPKEAREALGREAQIGVTCHASKHLAMEAGEAGADYIAFGAFFPSTTKAKAPDGERPDLELIEWWAQLFEIPLVAIGGITPGNCVPLVTAGADFLAVCGGVWSGDEVANIRAFREAINAV